MSEQGGCSSTQVTSVRFMPLFGLMDLEDCDAAKLLSPNWNFPLGYKQNVSQVGMSKGILGWENFFATWLEGLGYYLVTIWWPVAQV